MEQVVDITWFRAWKIWWSYSWRACVLMPGANPAEVARITGMMAAAWPIVVAVMIALQAQAMRGMLNRARWSDLRVAVMPREQ